MNSVIPHFPLRVAQHSQEGAWIFRDDIWVRTNEQTQAYIYTHTSSSWNPRPAPPSYEIIAHTNHVTTMCTVIRLTVSLTPAACARLYGALMLLTHFSTGAKGWICFANCLFGLRFEAMYGCQSSKQINPLNYGFGLQPLKFLLPGGLLCISNF